MRLGLGLSLSSVSGQSLSLSVQSTANGGDTFTATASGGSGTGYTYDWTSNAPRSIVGASSGVVVAGLQSGTSTLRVTDSLGHTATANIVVTGIASLHNDYDSYYVTQASNLVSNIANGVSGGQDLVQATGGSQPSYSASDAAYAGLVGSPPMVTTPGGKVIASAADTVAQPYASFFVGQFAAGNPAYGWGGGGGPFVQDNAGNTELLAGTALTDPVAHTSPSAIVTFCNGTSSFVGNKDFVTGGTTGNAGTTGMSLSTLFGAGGFNNSSAKMRKWITKSGANFTSGEKTMLKNWALNACGITVT